MFITRSFQRVLVAAYVMYVVTVYRHVLLLLLVIMSPLRKEDNVMFWNDNSTKHLIGIPICLRHSF